ncbi:lanthionine synthetase C-like protein-like protein 1 [Sporormia fimetaria CBS 119925]|uniref:Lanthionine synthetase C-like protein-like protein 1 n=1 Tax=Sporormia fimetaria CBS 119925 TaxID=1340428 RepID=A0A6A6VL92_9PLEO|nr:lanthionine synthetase C-like protein-like protein 1 [Sporormia fimetaria CBS 119925]
MGQHDEASAQATPPRYFRNDAEPTRRDPHKQLLASLQRLVNDYPPHRISPGGGLYYGPISVAYLFYALHKLYPDLTVDEYPLNTWSAAYIEQAQKHFKDYPGPSASKCGVSDDVMCLLALYAVTAKDTDTAKELCDFAAVTIEQDASNEWLYGRSGYLYLLRLVRGAFRDNREIQELIEDTADEVIENIMDSPRPWKWHGKAYVGAVHGAIGIITQIVLTDPSWAPKLEAELGALLSYQYESGNFPSSLPPGRDRLVQFCHGAPGVVASLISIQKYFPEIQDRISRVVEKGRECIRERGLLTKEPCLCHGITGNALALEDRDFEHFLTYTTGHEMRSMAKDGMLVKSDDPSALWCGEAGRAWAWAVADKKLEKRFLGYNDI